MSHQSIQMLTGLFFSSILLAGCGATTIKTTNKVDATAESSSGDSATAKQKGPEVGRLKKRKIPYRPNPNPVTNKALADNLLAARKNEVKRFLKQGADANTVASNGEPVLYTALRVGFNDIADDLVLYGADVNATNRAGRTPLHLAIDKGNEQIVQLLLENGADANKPGRSGEVPLHMAIAKAQPGIVDKLLKYGANPNRGSRHGTPLQVVLKNGNVTIAELLAKRGADVNITDSIGETLLHKAAARGQLGFAKVIIKHGANVNARDKYKETPLHEAAAKGRLEMVKLLLANGADLYAKTEKNWTALHEAARFGYPETAAYLVSRGLSRNASNSDGNTPKSLAKHLKHGEVLQILK